MKTAIIKFSTIIQEGGILSPQHYLGYEEEILTEIERLENWVTRYQLRLERERCHLREERLRIKKLQNLMWPEE
jgi:hypothetical protein